MWCSKVRSSVPLCVRPFKSLQKEFLATSCIANNRDRLNNHASSSAYSTDSSRGRARQLRSSWKRDTSSTWTNADELADVLAANVLYYDPDRDPKGLLAVNKPNGVPVNCLDDSPCGLKDALPALAQRMGVKKLHYIKAPERFTSGVTLLATSQSGVEAVKGRCKKTSAAKMLFQDAYLCLTNGFPRRDLMEETVDVISERCDVTEPVFSKHHIEVVVDIYFYLYFCADNVFFIFFAASHISHPSLQELLAKEPRQGEAVQSENGHAGKVAVGSGRTGQATA